MPIILMTLFPERDMGRITSRHDFHRYCQALHQLWTPGASQRALLLPTHLHDFDLNQQAFSTISSANTINLAQLEISSPSTLPQNHLLHIAEVDSLAKFNPTDIAKAAPGGQPSHVTQPFLPHSPFTFPIEPTDTTSVPVDWGQATDGWNAPLDPCGLPIRDPQSRLASGKLLGHGRKGF